MIKLVCYGDSNTYGCDPRSYIGDRLPPEQRFTGILNLTPGFSCAEYGLNGRQFPVSGAEFRELQYIIRREAPFDCLTVMLGSNDVLFGASPTAAAAGKRLDGLLTRIAGFPEMGDARVLVVSPPAADMPGVEWRCRVISELSSVFEPAAARHGAFFMAAGALPLSFDGAHLSPEGHRFLAEKLITKLNLILTG